MKTLERYRNWCNTWSTSQLVFLTVMSLAPTFTGIYLYVLLTMAETDAAYWKEQAKMQENRVSELRSRPHNYVTVR